MHVPRCRYRGAGIEVQMQDQPDNYGVHLQLPVVGLQQGGGPGGQGGGEEHGAVQGEHDGGAGGGGGEPGGSRAVQ